MIKLIPKLLAVIIGLGGGVAAHAETVHIDFVSRIPDWVGQDIHSASLVLKVDASGRVTDISTGSSGDSRGIVVNGRFEAGIAQGFTLHLRMRPAKTVSVESGQLGEIAVPGRFHFTPAGVGVADSPRAGNIGFSEETGSEGMGVELRVDGLPRGKGIEITQIYLDRFDELDNNEALFIDMRNQRAARIRSSDLPPVPSATNPFDVRPLQLRHLPGQDRYQHILTIMAGNPAAFRIKGFGLQIVDL